MKKIILFLMIAIPTITNAQATVEAEVISNSNRTSGVARLESGELVVLINNILDRTLAPGTRVMLKAIDINDPTRPMLGAIDDIDRTRPMLGAIDNMDRTRPMRVVAIK